jgi:hypothetical protein
VFQARVYGHESIFPHVEKHVAVLLGTVKFLKPAPDPALPEGFEAMDVDGVEVWTDGAPKATVKNMVKQLLTAFKAVDDALPGVARDKRKPRLIVCKKQADFDALGKVNDQGTGWKCVFAEQHRRAIVASAVNHKKRRVEFADDMAFFAGILRGRHYFGGPVPRWIEFGLGFSSRHAGVAKGKPARPRPTEVKKAKFAVKERKTPLNELFVLRTEDIDPDDLATANLETWAWYYYLLYGPGKATTGGKFAEHYAELRKTGDPLLARKVWEGTDMVALRDEFVTWAEKKWK